MKLEDNQVLKLSILFLMWRLWNGSNRYYTVHKTFQNLPIPKTVVVLTPSSRVGESHQTHC